MVRLVSHERWLLWGSCRRWERGRRAAFFSTFPAVILHFEAWLTYWSYLGMFCLTCSILLDNQTEAKKSIPAHTWNVLTSNLDVVPCRKWHPHSFWIVVSTPRCAPCTDHHRQKKLWKIPIASEKESTVWKPSQVTRSASQTEPNPGRSAEDEHLCSASISDQKTFSVLTVRFRAGRNSCHVILTFPPKLTPAFLLGLLVSTFPSRCAPHLTK